MAAAVDYDVRALSTDQCLLLAAQFASTANPQSLRALAHARHDALKPETLLRVLLTYLPEVVSAEQYIPLLEDVASTDAQSTASPLNEPVALNIQPVADLTAAVARRRAQALDLLPLAHAHFPAAEYPQPVLQFLIHRAHRIEREIGQLDMVPQLVLPFLDRYPALREWFVGNMLPLLRLDYEYYPDGESGLELERVELADDAHVVELWLSKTGSAARSETLARDIKGLVGPWMYGQSARKRRRFNSSAPSQRRASTAQGGQRQSDHRSQTPAGWEAVFKELVDLSAQDLVAVEKTIAAWDGPSDVDLGGFAEDSEMSAEQRQTLVERYAQAALASIYCSECGDVESMQKAWSILAKVSGLIHSSTSSRSLHDFYQQLLHKPAPDFPVLDTPNVKFDYDVLLKVDHPLCKADETAVSLVGYNIVSAFLLAEFGRNLTISNTLKLRSLYDDAEQQEVYSKLLSGLRNKQQNDEGWRTTRESLIWLWGWRSGEPETELGNGIFGKISRKSYEKQILEAIVKSENYSVALDIYVADPSRHGLTLQEVEQGIVSVALEQYDEASNANRTRGHMKKASDIVATFSKHFPNSVPFQRLGALLTATHAMSSYSITLHHGVPFQPVNIRASSDPLSLIEVILSQNPGSYARVHDLTAIGANLVAAGITDEQPAFDVSSDDELLGIDSSEDKLATKQQIAQRRVMGMAIEAALSENDFETAYSYVVNFLNPSEAAHQAAADDTDPSSSHLFTANDDDIAWRAALAAGKHRSTAPAPAASTGAFSSLAASGMGIAGLGGGSAAHTEQQALRRLEQRMDLLSQALLLAPPHALLEILAAWRKCEEELTALLAASKRGGDDDDDGWDSLQPGGNDGGDMPGAYEASPAPVQARREVGRGAAEEAPLGLFDVARGAAAAFSKSAFPLRAQAQRASVGQKAVGTEQGGYPSASGGGAGVGENEGDGHVRRRDMVANAVTGGLASGLGWVLGATPQTDN